MQTRLLPLLKDLERQAVPTCGLWLVHGDDALACAWLIDACRPIWSKNNQVIQRMELTSPKSWHDALNELTALSLFDDSTALIVTGKHKIDPKDTALMTSLGAFAQDVKDGNNQNHLIWCLPKQDKKSLASKSIQFFDTHGLIIDAHVYDERLRGELLGFKAGTLGLQLDPHAWQMLMTATEGNLLTAYQALWRLSFLAPDTPVQADTLEQALVAGADFNVFDLSDALLSGNAPKALAILSHLRHTDTAPSVVLWAIAKDARLILQIQAGKHPSSLGIWQSKTHAYAQIAQRTQGMSHDWLTQIYTIDKTIKGASHLNVWGEIERLCLSMCGVASP